MKFCGNCGKQIEDNANVCPYCGTPQGGGRPQMGGQPGGFPGAGQFGGQFGGFQAAGAKSEGLTLPKILMLAGGGLTFLACFFSAITVSAGGWGLDYSVGLSMFSVGFMGVLVFLLALAVIALVIVDAFVKPMGMIPLIVGAVDVLWFIIMFIYLLVQKGNANSLMGGGVEAYGVSAGASLGFGFWLYLIASLVIAAGTVLAFLNSQKR